MGELAKLIGEPIGGQVAQQVALRGIKAAALATRPSPSEDRGYAYVDFSAGPYKPSGVRAVAFVPGAYAEEPELFYGPFAQVGTYLKGKGVIESEGVAFALDLALDPINLLSFGTAGLAGKATKGAISGLTEVGKLSRLISAVTAGGEIRNGANVVDRVISVVEEAGKLAGSSDEIIAAAKAGDDAALKGIVNNALASGEIGETVRPTIEALKRDRKTLGKFLEHLDDFKARYGEGPIPEEAFLQGTVRGRLAAGQVNPLISIVNPFQGGLAETARHPLRFTRQMLGFHYANERFVLPMANSAVEGLEKVGKGSLFEIPGAVKPYENIKAWEGVVTSLEKRRPALVERVGQAKRLDKMMSGGLGDESQRAAQLELDSLDDNIKETKRLLLEAKAKGETGPGLFDRIVAEKEAFRPGTFREGDLDSANAVMAMHMARLLPASPTDRLFADVGYEAVNEETLTKAYKALNPDAPKEIPKETLDAFANDVLKDLNGSRRAIDSERLRYRSDLMDNLASDFRRSISADPAQQASEAAGLSEIQQDVMVNQMRRAMDVFSIRSLQMDAFSPGNGLAARASFQGLMAKMTTDNVRSVIKGAYQGRLAREAIAEIPQGIIAHPELFELRDGKYFLTGSFDDIEKEGASFLRDTLHRSKASKKSAFLEEHLRTEGLNPEVSRLVSEMKATYDMIGKNLVENEGILKGFRDDYFSRVWRWSDKGRKEAHLHAEALGIKEVMSQDADGQLLDSLMGDEIKVLAGKANQGKVTFEEARKTTEASLRRLEKLGYGTFEKDAVALFSGYLEASGRSILINRLWRDMPEISESLTRGALGTRASTLSDEALRKVQRITRKDPPTALLPHYKRMYVRPRTLGPGDDPEALAKTLLLDKQLASAEETARKKVAAALDGKKKVGGYRLRDKVTGEPVPFRAEWVLTDSIPESVVGARDIKGSVAEMIQGDDVLTKPRGQVAKHKAEIEAGVGKARGAAEGASKEAERGGLWVFEDDYNHIAEAFAIRDKTSSQFWQKYDRYNAAFKSVVLIGDVFHFNVLSISQALLDPTSVMKHLFDDAGKLLPGAREGGFGLGNAAVKAAAGAAVGAGVGAASGQDERGVATFSLVGALYGAVIGAALNNARTGIKAAMNPAHIDTLHWMGVGGWRGRPDDRSIGILNRGLKTLRDRLSREPDNGALIHAIDGVRHVADAWDELLWSTLHNGSKHHYFQVKWGQELPKLEARAAFKASSEAEQFAAKSALAREIVQTSNNVFGGQTMRFLFDNPEFSHIARRFLLSPDWTASRLALASGFFMNMDPAKQALIGAGLGVGVQAVESGGDPDYIFSWRGPVLGAGLGLALGKWAKGIGRRMMTPGDVMAREARRVASSALLGGYVFANVVNYGLTGRWMFQNEEGRKTSIDIGGGNWVQLGKPWVEPFEFAGIYEPGKHRIPGLSRLVSKGATLPISALRLLANQNGFGGPLIMPDDSPFEMAAKIIDVTIPLPIITSGPVRLGLDALQGEATTQQIGAAGIRSLGFPVRGPGRGGPGLDIGALQRVIQSSAGRFSQPPPALVGAGQSPLESGL